jgi:hypothetical protein
MTKKARVLLIVCFLSALLLLGTAFYTQTYYHADEAAIEALSSDELVNVSQTDYGWFFDGPSEEDAFIFYPGGKVEETAYAPLLRRLAEEGVDVMLVSMPARLAILDVDAAEKVLAEYEYEHWYIGGHSLGGASSALYASENEDKFDGIILLGAFSTKPLEDERVLFIYGSEDQVLNMEKFINNRANVPENAEEYVIEGGNHAQFGSYGVQQGDGSATISGEEQVEITVDLIISFLQEANQ